MKNKKIIMSFLLILLIAISVSAVSAEDISNDISSDSDSDDLIMTEEISKDASEKSLEDGITISNNRIVKPSNGTSDAENIQKGIDEVDSGASILLNYNGDQNFTLEKTVNINKDITIEGGVIYNTNNLSTMFSIPSLSNGGPKSVTITGTTFYVNGNESIVSAIGEDINSDSIMEIANITIVNCKILPINMDISSDIRNTSLLKIESDISTTNCTGLINITGNIYGEAKSLNINDEISNTSNIIILPKKIILNTTISTGAAIIYDKKVESPNYLTIKLSDINGNPLANKTLILAISEEISIETDENGTAKYLLNISDICPIYIGFLGNDDYYGDFVVVNPVKKTSYLTVKTTKYRYNYSKKILKATFKDAKGHLIANKKVKFTVNGKTYTGSTNSKGVASVKISLTKKGTFTYTAKFAGDSLYNAKTVKGKLKITKGLTPTLTVKKYTFKKSATKKIKVKLKYNGEALASRKISIKVNKKTYSAKTNSKGVATITIKLTKKGTYTYTAKYGGNYIYKPVSKSTKVYIK